MSENSETAILAGGRFWPAQELLRHRDGVIFTASVYRWGEGPGGQPGNHSVSRAAA